jgi:hypothetical protein
MQTPTIQFGARGGRDLAATPTLNARTPVRLVYPYDRAADRYVTVTTVRLHATTTYVVAMTDGTGRLTSDLKPSLHTDPTNARRTAQRHIDRWGVAKQPLPPEPSTSNGRPPRPKQTKSGRWVADFTHQRQKYRQLFDSEQEAQVYIETIKGGL